MTADEIIEKKNVNPAAARSITEAFIFINYVEKS